MNSPPPREELRDLPRLLDQGDALDDVCESILAEILEVVGVRDDVPKAGRSIIVDGQPGTGKSSIAYTVHERLKRDHGFVPVRSDEVQLREDCPATEAVLTLPRQRGTERTGEPPPYPRDAWSLDLSLVDSHWNLFAAFLEIVFSEPALGGQGKSQNHQIPAEVALRKEVRALRQGLASKNPEYRRWAAAMAENEEQLLDQVGRFHMRIAVADNASFRVRLARAKEHWERVHGMRGWVLFLDDADLLSADALETIQTLRFHLQVPGCIAVVTANMERWRALLQAELMVRAGLGGRAKTADPGAPNSGIEAAFAQVADNLVRRVTQDARYIRPLESEASIDFGDRIAVSSLDPAVLGRTFPLGLRGTLMRILPSFNVNGRTSHDRLEAAQLLEALLPKSRREWVHVLTQLTRDSLPGGQNSANGRLSAQRAFLRSLLLFRFPMVNVFEDLDAPAFRVEGELPPWSPAEAHRLLERWRRAAPRLRWWLPGQPDDYAERLVAP